LKGKKLFYQDCILSITSGTANFMCQHGPNFIKEQSKSAAIEGYYHYMSLFFLIANSRIVSVVFCSTSYDLAYLGTNKDTL